LSAAYPHHTFAEWRFVKLRQHKWHKLLTNDSYKDIAEFVLATLHQPTSTKRDVHRILTRVGGLRKLLKIAVSNKSLNRQYATAQQSALVQLLKDLFPEIGTFSSQASQFIR